MKRIVIFIIVVTHFLGASANKVDATQRSFEYLVEIEEKRENVLDSIIKYTKEILVLVGLSAGIVLGYPAIRKKLVEDHVKKIIEDIQDSNKEIKILCQSLSDKHLSRTYKTEIISINEIQQAYYEVDELHKKALNASKEVVTFTFLLKRTIQGILRRYDTKNQSYRIFTNEFYGFYINILYEITFFATKIVNIPTNTRTVRIKYINRKIKKYVVNNKFKKFKYIEQGVDNKYASQLLLSFYGNIYRINNIIILRAAYTIFSSPAPISRLLFLNELYFPPILKKREPTLFIYEKLNLIGIIKQVQYGAQGKREIVQLLYANIGEMFNFVGTLTKQDIEDNFIDDYILSKGIDLKKAIKIKIGNLEEMTIDLEKDYLNELFNINKKLLKEKMLKEMN